MLLERTGANTPSPPPALRGVGTTSLSENEENARHSEVAWGGGMEGWRQKETEDEGRRNSLQNGGSFSPWKELAGKALGAPSDARQARHIV